MGWGCLRPGKRRGSPPRLGSAQVSGVRELHEELAGRPEPATPSGGEIPNYFEPDWVAPRYAAARPDIHSTVVAHLRELLAPRGPLVAALDVGCGTGLSTRPLVRLSARVVGADPAPFMLREARRAGGASYVRARAELLPFPRATFDLLTIGCAYHWCDPEAFLGEARRVLQPSGHLVLYDNFFYGESPRSSELYDWLSSQHWSQLPRTRRNALPEVGAFHHPSFELVHSCTLDRWVSMSRDSLVVYLTTQSRAVAAVESGERTVEDIESFLLSGLSKLVPSEGGEFRFGGPLWVVRPVG